LLIFYAKNVKNTRLNRKTSAWSLCVSIFYMYIYFPFRKYDLPCIEPELVIFGHDNIVCKFVLYLLYSLHEVLLSCFIQDVVLTDTQYFCEIQRCDI